MRGDELVGLWGVIRAVEASPNESIVTEVVGPMIYRGPYR